MSKKKDGPPSANFRKPPPEFQYKPGTSGNLKGRPPKKRPAPMGFGTGGGITDRLSSIAMEEAMRPVTVRDGDKVSEMPAFQAAFRTMVRAAAQGNTKAASQVLEFLGQAEKDRAERAAAILGFASDYKEKFTEQFERHKRLGWPPPDIYPHPDDVIINEATGEVKIDGPMSKDAAEAWEAFRPIAQQKVKLYFEAQELLAKDPKNRFLQNRVRELEKYPDFLEKDARRKARHKAAQIGRDALKKARAKPSESEGGDQK